MVNFFQIYLYFYIKNLFEISSFLEVTNKYNKYKYIVKIINIYNKLATYLGCSRLTI